MTSCHWAITRLHQDTQKEPLPTVMGSGRLQGWQALDPLWDSVAEDVRGIGIGRERGNIGIGKEREAFLKKKKSAVFTHFMRLHRNWSEGCYTDTLSKLECVKCLDDIQVCIFTLSLIGF